jgi:hypothetical protein
MQNRSLFEKLHTIKHKTLEWEHVTLTFDKCLLDQLYLFIYVLYVCVCMSVTCLCVVLSVSVLSLLYVCCLVCMSMCECDHTQRVSCFSWFNKVFIIIIIYLLHISYLKLPIMWKVDSWACCYEAWCASNLTHRSFNNTCNIVFLKLV